MGKNLQHQGTGISLNSNHPGCMWGILHVLHHHRWHQVRRKMLPQKRRGGGRNATGSGSPGNSTSGNNSDEMKEQPDAENITLIEEKATEPTPFFKSSMKSRIKALIADEMSKRRGRAHHRSSSYPTRMQLRRTDSIHHLESGDLNPLNEVSSNDAIVHIVHQNDENSSSSKQSKACEEPVTGNKKCELCAAMFAVNYMGHSQVSEHGKQPVENDPFLQDNLDKAKQPLLANKKEGESDKDVSFYDSKQFLDALDLFNMNKELFLKVLQDPNSPLAHYFHGRQAFKCSKKGFSKSMSFPSASLLGRKDFMPSKLKHETESCAKGEEKTQVDSQVQKSAEVESTEDTSESCTKPYVEKPESLEPGLKTQKDNKVVIKHFKNLKQKIKHAIKESRKERHRITMDAVLHKIPYGRKFQKEVRGDVTDLWKETSMDNKCSKCGPRSSFESEGKGGQRHLRSLSSSDESLDKYRQLYETSFNTEATQHKSEKLKLRTERTVPKTLGRILSLPDLRRFYYLHVEDSPEAPSSGTQIRTDVNSNVSIVNSNRLDETKASELPVGSENETQLDGSVEIGSENSLVEFVGELNTVGKDEVGLRSFTDEETEAKDGFSPDDLGSLTTTEGDVQQDNEVQATTSPVSKMEEPIPSSVLDSSQEDMISPTEFLFEVSRLKPQTLFSDEVDSLDTLVSQKHDASIDSPILAKSKVHLEKLETSIEQLNTEFLHVLVNAKDVPEFNYVKYVLELSGFSRNELLGTWHSPDHPVDPSLFDEVEGCLFPELDYIETEEGGNCNHLLLFDLINEVLLGIYERSFTYCPLPLSTNSRIRPIPMGNHVLEEVWANISWYLRWRPQDDQSLDNAVTRDLAKADGWMNLQFEAECVGLELEDMIFDDLLDELIWT